MIATQTTIPDAWTAFLADLTLACANVDPDIQICDGPPVEQVAADYVALTGWENEHSPATLGGGPRGFQVEEVYDLTGLIRCFRGDSIVTARTQALLIFAAVEAQVRADPQLGGAIRVCWITRSTGKLGPTNKGGTACEIDFALHCEARIT